MNAQARRLDCNQSRAKPRRRRAGTRRNFYQKIPEGERDLSAVSAETDIKAIFPSGTLKQKQGYTPVFVLLDIFFYFLARQSHFSRPYFSTRVNHGTNSGFRSVPQNGAEFISFRINKFPLYICFNGSPIVP